MLVVCVCALNWLNCCIVFCAICFFNLLSTAATCAALSAGCLRGSGMKLQTMKMREASQFFLNNGAPNLR